MNRREMIKMAGAATMGATVLGVPTLTYLPYCFFNLLCPLMTLLVATLGWRIKHKDPETETVNAQEYEVQD